MDNPTGALLSIQQKISYLNPALAKIGQFVLDHPEACKTITIKELATECSVAESSVTRFVKELGYDSYQDLKIAIAESLSHAQEQSPSQPYIYEDIAENDNTQTIIEKVYYRNVQMLTQTKQVLNPEALDRAADIIEKAQALIFSGKGSSAIAAEEGIMRFTRAGKKCLFFRDESQQLITVSAATPQDVVIGISNSGHSISVVSVMELARERGVPTIGITAFENSPLTKHADITLFTPTKQSDSNDGMGWESTSSKSAQIMVMDILYACYASRQYNLTRTHLEKSYMAIRHTRR